MAGLPSQPYGHHSAGGPHPHSRFPAHPSALVGGPFTPLVAVPHPHAFGHPHGAVPVAQYSAVRAHQQGAHPLHPHPAYLHHQPLAYPGHVAPSAHPYHHHPLPLHIQQQPRPIHTAHGYNRYPIPPRPPSTARPGTTATVVGYPPLLPPPHHAFHPFAQPPPPPALSAPAQRHQLASMPVQHSRRPGPSQPGLRLGGATPTTNAGAIRRHVPTPSAASASALSVSSTHFSGPARSAVASSDHGANKSGSRAGSAVGPPPASHIPPLRMQLGGVGATQSPLNSPTSVRTMGTHLRSSLLSPGESPAALKTSYFPNIPLTSGMAGPSSATAATRAWALAAPLPADDVWDPPVQTHPHRWCAAKLVRWSVPLIEQDAANSKAWCVRWRRWIISPVDYQDDVIELDLSEAEQVAKDKLKQEAVWKVQREMQQAAGNVNTTAVKGGRQLLWCIRNEHRMFWSNRFEDPTKTRHGVKGDASVMMDGGDEAILWAFEVPANSELVTWLEGDDGSSSTCDSLWDEPCDDPMTSESKGHLDSLPTSRFKEVARGRLSYPALFPDFGVTPSCANETEQSHATSLEPAIASASAMGLNCSTNRLSGPLAFAPARDDSSSPTAQDVVIHAKRQQAAAYVALQEAIGNEARRRLAQSNPRFLTWCDNKIIMLPEPEALEPIYRSLCVHDPVAFSAQIAAVPRSIMVGINTWLEPTGGVCEPKFEPFDGVPLASHEVLTSIPDRFDLVLAPAGIEAKFIRYWARYEDHELEKSANAEGTSWTPEQLRALKLRGNVETRLVESLRSTWAAEIGESWTGDEGRLWIVCEISSDASESGGEPRQVVWPADRCLLACAKWRSSHRTQSALVNTNEVARALPNLLAQGRLSLLNSLSAGSDEQGHFNVLSLPDRISSLVSRTVSYVETAMKERKTAVASNTSMQTKTEKQKGAVDAGTTPATPAVSSSGFTPGGGATSATPKSAALYASPPDGIAGIGTAGLPGPTPPSTVPTPGVIPTTTDVVSLAASQSAPERSVDQSAKSTVIGDANAIASGVGTVARRSNEQAGSHFWDTDIRLVDDEDQNDEAAGWGGTGAGYGGGGGGLVDQFDMDDLDIDEAFSYFDNPPTTRARNNDDRGSTNNHIGKADDNAPIASGSNLLTKDTNSAKDAVGFAVPFAPPAQTPHTSNSTINVTNNQHSPAVGPSPAGGPVGPGSGFTASPSSFNTALFENPTPGSFSVQTPGRLGYTPDTGAAMPTPAAGVHGFQNSPPAVGVAFGTTLGHHGDNDAFSDSLQNNPQLSPLIPDAAFNSLTLTPSSPLPSRTQPSGYEEVAFHDAYRCADQNYAVRGGKYSLPSPETSEDDGFNGMPALGRFWGRMADPRMHHLRKENIKSLQLNRGTSSDFSRNNVTQSTGNVAVGQLRPWWREEDASDDDHEGDWDSSDVESALTAENQLDDDEDQIVQASRIQAELVDTLRTMAISGKLSVARFSRPEESASIATAQGPDGDVSSTSSAACVSCLGSRPFYVSLLSTVFPEFGYGKPQSDFHEAPGAENIDALTSWLPPLSTLSVKQTELTVLAPPSIAVRYNDTQLAFPSGSLRHWSKLRLEPVSGPRDLCLSLLVPRTKGPDGAQGNSEKNFDKFQGISWMQGVANAYKACRLGTITVGDVIVCETQSNSIAKNIQKAMKKSGQMQKTSRHAFAILVSGPQDLNSASVAIEGIWGPDERPVTRLFVSRLEFDNNNQAAMCQQAFRLYDITSIHIERFRAPAMVLPPVMLTTAATTPVSTTSSSALSSSSKLTSADLMTHGPAFYLHDDRKLPIRLTLNWPAAGIDIIERYRMYHCSYWISDDRTCLAVSFGDELGKHHRAWTNTWSTSAPMNDILLHCWEGINSDLLNMNVEYRVVILRLGVLSGVELAHWKTCIEEQLGNFSIQPAHVTLGCTEFSQAANIALAPSSKMAIKDANAVQLLNPDLEAGEVEMVGENEVFDTSQAERIYLDGMWVAVAHETHPRPIWCSDFVSTLTHPLTTSHLFHPGLSTGSSNQGPTSLTVHLLETFSSVTCSYEADLRQHRDDILRSLADGAILKGMRGGHHDVLPWDLSVVEMMSRMIRTKVFERFDTGSFQQSLHADREVAENDTDVSMQDE